MPLGSRKENELKILAIGDITSPGGALHLEKNLWAIRRKFGIDFCVVNGENASQNNGISRRKAESILGGGADVITLGNHAFRNKDAFNLLRNEKRIIRPMNFPPDISGNL